MRLNIGTCAVRPRCHLVAAPSDQRITLAGHSSMNWGSELTAGSVEVVPITVPGEVRPAHGEAIPRGAPRGARSEANPGSCIQARMLCRALNGPRFRRLRVDAIIEKTPHPGKSVPYTPRSVNTRGGWG